MARALNRAQDAGELGQDAVTSCVDDAAAERADHGQYDRLMALEIPHRAGLVRAHQRAVAGDVSGQDCCKPAGLAFRHGSPPETRPREIKRRASRGHGPIDEY